MSGNGKVFISHAYHDTEACQPVLAALASWDVDYCFQAERAETDEALAPQVEQQIAARDIFLRVLSREAQASYWVRLETQTFLRLRHDEQQTTRLTTQRTEASAAPRDADDDMPEEAVSGEDDDDQARSESDLPNDRAQEPSAYDDAHDDAHDDAQADATRGQAGRRTLIDLSLDGTRADPVGDYGTTANDTYIDMTTAHGLFWRTQLHRALGLVEPGTETGEVPAVSAASAHEALSELLSGGQSRVALPAPDDTVVSVAIADREADANAADSRAVCLVVLQGNNVGRIYPLVSNRITMGRRHDNDVILADMAVSRQHAALIRDAEGRYVLYDEGSKNGTFVNGEPITERVLADGDTIRCGQIVLQFRLPRTHD